ncbi:hypothetical protein TNCV_1002831 [Trichonephila clavipes]|nr:hypothetical protein TNCV_1002831 [Trichonephila clavipes]
MKAVSVLEHFSDHGSIHQKMKNTTSVRSYPNSAGDGKTPYEGLVFFHLKLLQGNSRDARGHQLENTPQDSISFLKIFFQTECPLDVVHNFVVRTPINLKYFVPLTFAPLHPTSDTSVNSWVLFRPCSNCDKKIIADRI